MQPLFLARNRDCGIVISRLLDGHGCSRKVQVNREPKVSGICFESTSHRASSNNLTDIKPVAKMEKNPRWTAYDAGKTRIFEARSFCKPSRKSREGRTLTDAIVKHRQRQNPADRFRRICFCNQMRFAHHFSQCARDFLSRSLRFPFHDLWYHDLFSSTVKHGLSEIHRYRCNPSCYQRVF